MPALMIPKRTEGLPPASSFDLEQGVIEEARRRRRARHKRIGLSGIVVLAGLGVGTWMLSSATGASHGRLALPADPPRVASHASTPPSTFNLRLSPSLDGGTAGWCVAVDEIASRGIAGGGCGALPVSTEPFVTAMSGESLKTRTETITVLTTPAVAAILVNGRRRVATVVPPGVPYGLRAAQLVLPLKVKRSKTGRLGVSMPREPRLTALTASGRPLSTPGERGEPLRLSPHGPCALNAAGLPGLQPKWSHVAAAIESAPIGLVGRAFFSCIDTEYFLGPSALDAAVLLDAAHPGSLPAAIPGLTSVPGTPRYVNGQGYFNGPGDFKGELTATRIGDAWLVVAGGSGLKQRIEVLRHLSASVRLRTSGVIAGE
jgi:hypothetical protein